VGDDVPGDGRPGFASENGLMRRREASINDVPIDEHERRIFGPRPEAERGRSFPVR
jgi:nuclear transport factor 2 (NTF2) superfamily protein